MNKIQQKTIKPEHPVDVLGRNFLAWIFKDRSFWLKILPIFLIITTFDLLENIASAGTSYAIVYSTALFIMPSAIAKTFAITYLALFEAAKMLIYVSFFLDLVNGRFSWIKFVFLLLLSAMSVLQTVKGTTPLVHTFKKPVKEIQVSEMAVFYKEEIATLNAQIAHLHKNDDKAYTRVTAKDVNKLTATKEDYAAKLEALEGKRSIDNKTIKVQESGMVSLTSSVILRIVLALNFLSLFFFAPVMAWILNKAHMSFGGKMPSPTPSKTQRNSNAHTGRTGGTGHAHVSTNKHKPPAHMRTPAQNTGTPVASHTPAQNAQGTHTIEVSNAHTQAHTHTYTDSELVQMANAYRVRHTRIHSAKNSMQSTVDQAEKTKLGSLILKNKSKQEKFGAILQENGYRIIADNNDRSRVSVIKDN